MGVLTCPVPCHVAGTIFRQHPADGFRYAGRLCRIENIFRSGIHPLCLNLHGYIIAGTIGTADVFHGDAAPFL